MGCYLDDATNGSTSCHFKWQAEWWFRGFSVAWSGMWVSSCLISLGFQKDVNGGLAIFTYLLLRLCWLDKRSGQDGTETIIVAPAMQNQGSTGSLVHSPQAARNSPRRLMKNITSGGWDCSAAWAPGGLVDLTVELNAEVGWQRVLQQVNDESLWI